MTGTSNRTSGQNISKRTQRRNNLTGEIFDGNWEDDTSNIGSRGYIYRVKMRFVRIFCSSKTEFVVKKLSQAHAKYILLLLLRLQTGTNLLVKRTSYSRNVPMSRRDIQNYLEISERATRNFLSEMQKKKIIKASKTVWNEKPMTVYYMNPSLWHSGKWLDYTAYYAFEDELKEEVPMAVREHLREQKENSGS